ncbi:glycosyltransferase involved in cell wall biosynthesis [Marinobacter sp. 3-2]|jgi:glycosyltransferase involved in cell wall biosynthesis|uniref:glycosyltransferase n=1 Tax=Marinobacter sp. 3-2 TaxID=2485141 RepID=UPI000D365AFD|nr:glycosyltransferase [Marinobacter sp. 3-2]ROQ48440.1 glycosyltransferase involved in cell wall biosynthesis [Marinobacter sp. 3-2]
MKILKVIHGYPMLYNAGSEVYSQTICHALAERGHDVHVFTREEDAFRPDGSLRQDVDHDQASIRVHLVNNPRHRDRYRLSVIDQRFAELLDQIKPDVVHIGHLNHLSTSLVYEAKRRKVPVVYTLHDYWLMCPRGQFMQMHSGDDNLWAACDGQENRKCATQCYARYFSGAQDEFEQDVAYWENWVGRRMAHVRDVVDQVDLFISPSRYLKSRYETDFGLPKPKSIYLDYGFDRSRMADRQRTADEPFTFGYIGTHIPAKGIHQLIQAFGQVKGECQLRIWGRDRGRDSRALRAIANTLPIEKQAHIHWMPEYKNQQITKDVFDKTDAIVTPSIWVENSPLVIHEAQQARVPVITADAGGMGEYVQHEVNGLLYQHRDVSSLSQQMQRLVDAPELARQLGQRGYLFSDDGQIPDIQSHVVDLEEQYKRVMN